MYSAEEKERIKEVCWTILRSVWKDFCDKIAKMAADRFSEILEQMNQDDLRCILYAHMINKSRGGK